ncbi:MAG: pitrilysin family protein [Pseudomonadota bacterium]
MIRFNTLFSLAFVFTSLLATAVSAVEIQQVRSAKGINALLVEDYTLPILAMTFSFAGGSTQDPAGKEGTARLMTSLFDEGAGELDSVSFRSKLEENGIELGFSVGREQLSVSLRTLVQKQDIAFDLLKTALISPRFDISALERMRDAIRTGLKRGKTDPNTQAGKVLRESLFPDHAYSRPVSGTLESIDSINIDDVEAMHRKLVTRGDLTIGVVGAISPEELTKILDKLFGDISAQSDLQKVADIDPSLDQEVVLNMPVPNTSITVVYPGVKRNDPDFFAAHIMNHILGGGSFTSRLYEEVREKRGLTYGIYSQMATFDHTAYLSASTSTRASNRDETIKVIQEEITKMAKNGATQEELDQAKKFIKGAYAINNLDTSSKIARVLVAIQNQDLGIDYIDTREAVIDAVTLEDVNQIAKRLLSKAPTRVIVGPTD